MNNIKNKDRIVYDIINNELNRQQNGLEMIASENFTSLSVMEAMGSVLTNKYAEGYPGKRYYGGCEFVDNVENLAKERACEIFKCEYSNVQPHSGSQANMAVYKTFLKAGDSVLGLDLAHGGHLTHGSKVNFSGEIYNFNSYGVDRDSGRVDFNKVYDLAKKHKPKLIICGGSAYPRFVEFEKFKEVASSVGAYLMADIAHPSGLVAAGLHPSPWPHCDIATTTTHKTLRGPRGGLILSNNEELGKKLDKAVFPGTQGGPLEHVIAAKAVAFDEALTDEFYFYIQQVLYNSEALAKTLLKRGIDIVSGGSDNHIVLLDLRSIGMTGKVADALVSNVNITANKNTVPFDPESPFVTSGLRLGTSALTTRGFDQDAFVEVGNIIADILLNPNDSNVNEICKQRVATLCNLFPLYND